MKICLGNLALNVPNFNKNLLISVLSAEPEYEREVLSIHLHLHFKQAVVMRDLQHHNTTYISAASPNTDQSNFSSSYGQASY